MTLRTLNAQELIAELETLARLGNERVIVFDGDGTLWRCDVGEDAFEDAIERRLIREEARQPLAEVAEAHGVSTAGDANAIAARLYEGYRARSVPELATCEFMVWCYAGWEEEEVRQHARNAQNRHGLLTQTNRALLPVIGWAREAGVKTAVISASPQWIVEEAVRSLGFSASDVIAGRAEVERGRVLPRMQGCLPYAQEKANAGRARFGTCDWLASFGDSIFDIEMMHAARLAVLVRPRQELRERAHELQNAVHFAE